MLLSDSNWQCCFVILRFYADIRSRPLDISSIVYNMLLHRRQFTADHYCEYKPHHVILRLSHIFLQVSFQPLLSDRNDILYTTSLKLHS